MRKGLFIPRDRYIFIAAVSLINLSYVFIYKDRILAISVAAAMLFFAGAIVLTKRLQPEHDHLPWQSSPTRADRVRILPFILPFFIPLIFCSFHRSIVFWNFHGIARVALAWFIFSLIWLNFSKARNNEDDIKAVLAPFLLFTVWSVVLWLDLIWDAGSRTIFLKAISSQAIINSDRLATITFKIWETKPFSQHFGLAFTNYSAFKENAYIHFYQAYLFFIYLVLKFNQLLFNCKIEVATRLLPFFYSFILTAGVGFFFIKTSFPIQIRKKTTQLTFFFGLGFLLSLPDFWITLLKFDTDNNFPLIAYFSLFLFAYLHSNNYLSKMFIFILYLFCLMFPIYAFISLFTLCFFVFMPTGMQKYKIPSKKALIILSAGFLIALASFVYPYIIAKILKYKHVGSSLLYRSGLDGDTAYYDNIWQAVSSPYPYAKSLIRPWSSLIPAIIFCATAFLFAGLKRFKNGSQELMNSIFLFSPYLFSIVFTPQAVSIHPYLYDYLLSFPLGFMGVYWLCSQEFQQKIKGPWLYLFFLFMSGLVIYNLTKIAQAARNGSF